MLIEHASLIEPRTLFGAAADGVRAFVEDRFNDAGASRDQRQSGTGVRRLRSAPAPLDGPEPLTSGPAALLASMIHRMGGAATSTAKGDYVDLTV